MVLLQLDGYGWLARRRVSHVPAGSDRRERSTRPQILAPKCGSSLQDLRAVGLRCNCHSRFAAAPCAHGSVSARGGRHAISGQKIPGGPHVRPNLQIHGAGLFGFTVWAPNHCVHRGTWTPWSGGISLRADCRRRGFLFLARQQKEKAGMGHWRALFLKRTVLSRAALRSVASHSRAARRRN